MSTLNIYSVKDTKTNQFMSLELYSNDLDAERGIKFVCQRSADNLLNKFPEDFALYRLGTLNTDKCIEDKYDDPQKVCNISDILGTDKTLT